MTGLKYGWLLDCLSSRGIHVASRIVHFSSDERWYRYIWCWWQVFAPVMYVIMLNGYSTGYRQSSSLHTYVVLKTTMHGLSYALTLTLNTLLHYLCRLGIFLRDQNVKLDRSHNDWFYIPYARFRPHNYNSHSILPAVAQFGLTTGTFRLSLDSILCC